MRGLIWKRIRRHTPIRDASTAVLATALLLLTLSPPAWGQDRASLTRELLQVAEADAKKMVPTNMQPYEPGPRFIDVESMASGARRAGFRTADAAPEGFLPEGAEAARPAEVFERRPNGQGIRDDGLAMTVLSMERRSVDRLSVRFEYYVTLYYRDDASICLRRFLVELNRTAADDGWVVQDSRKLAGC